MKITLDKEKHPTLNFLLSQKVIWMQDGEFVGKASDGVEVSFGAIDDFNLNSIESYLRSNPSPDQW